MARSILSGLLRPAPFGPGDDPEAAPWALPGGPTDLPYRWHRVRPNLFLTYLVGIVFLVFAIPTIADGVGPVGLGLRIGYLVVLRRGLRRRGLDGRRAAPAPLVLRRRVHGLRAHRGAAVGVGVRRLRRVPRRS